jgi:2-polyprenyl-6-hydroxyphenyl methylase/3-demethylubiquinone-9 3-methyltransferase
VTEPLPRPWSPRTLCGGKRRDRANQPARRARNDPRQYDDLVAEWQRPGGEFAALHWLAAARAALVPPPSQPDAVLLDVGCGGGLLARHLSGYRHIGVDVVSSALRVAAAGGVQPVQADAAALPLPTGAVDVVVAGELFEHIDDLDAAVAEVARVLTPGGRVVCDTLNDTWQARLALVTVAERLPGGPPRRCHDPELFVAPERLRSAFAAFGIPLAVSGLRPSSIDYARFLVCRSRPVRMLPASSPALLYQAVGHKPPAEPAA